MQFVVIENSNPDLFKEQPWVSWPSKTLRYEAKLGARGVAIIKLILKDDGGTANGGQDRSAPQAFNITINAGSGTGVNHAPHFTKGPDQVSNADAGRIEIPDWATNVDDGDDGDGGSQNLQFVVIENSNPDLFKEQPWVSWPSKTLRYEAKPGARGAAIIKLILKDDGGTANGGQDRSAPQLVNIAINAGSGTGVNHAPSFSNGPDQTSNADAGRIEIPDWASNVDDGDGGSQNLQFVVIENSNPDLFKEQPWVSWPSKTLRYEAKPGARGAATIKLVLKDDGGTADGGKDTSAPQAFNITITADPGTGVNHAPSFTKGADQSVKMDAGPQHIENWATNIDDGDGNTQQLHFEITGNTNPNLFKTQPTIVWPSGALDYESKAGETGSATITVVLKDDGSTANGGIDSSTPQSFNITIGNGNINDPIADAGPDRIGKAAPDLNNLSVEDITYIGAHASAGMQFSWSVIAFDGSQTIPAYKLTSPTTRATGFAATSAGIYTLKLEADSGSGVTVADTVEVTLLEDSDGDGLVNGDDLDKDGDGFLNTDDAFPDDIVSHIDTNGDGTGNYYETDVDGDGTPDINDDFPLDPARNQLDIYTEAKEPAGSNLNDGIGVSEDVGVLPKLIKGSIDAQGNRPDVDYYKSGWTAGRFSVVVTGTDPQMSPAIAVMDSSGTVVPSLRSNLPAMPGVAAVSILLPADGEYFISVTDGSGQSDPAWTYQIKVVADDDFDGIGDDLERALDSSHLTPDSDGDGISDYAEISRALMDWDTYQDMDGDGIPSWWDQDSDGDGIPDALESVEEDERPDLTLAERMALNDADADGIPNFLDTDSDGNGISDTDEAGSNLREPVDTDRDATADYLDRDDDNDGLLDINETGNTRVEPLEYGDGSFVLPTNIQNSTRTLDTGSDVLTIDNVCRAGDTIVIEAQNLPANINNTWVILRGGSTIYNLAPSVTTVGNGLELTCPDDMGSGLFEVFFTDGIYASSSLNLMVPQEGAPLLFGVDMDSSTATAILWGENLDASLTVNYRGASVTVDNAEANRAVAGVPADTLSGPVFVSSVKGDSNTLFFSPLRRVTGNVVPPAGSTVNLTDIDVAFSPLEELFVDGSGNFETEAHLDRATIITGLLEHPDSTADNPRYASYLQAVVLPGENDIVLDANSTAVALVWQGIVPHAFLKQGQWEEARNLIAGLPEVTALASVLEQQLVADPYILASYPLDPTIETASSDALTAAVQAIQNAFPPSSQQAGKSRASIMARGLFGPDAEVTPSDANGIKVYEYDDTGNIEVENDTQLYLSTKITATNGTVLWQHVSGYFDTHMIGPQGWGLLFVAESKRYSLPKGRNVTVEVVTAGIGREYDPRVLPYKLGLSAVQNSLVQRVFIEKIFSPIMDAILPVINPSSLAKNLFKYGPTIVDALVCDNGSAKDDAFELYVDGNSQGVMYASPGNYCKSFQPNMDPTVAHTAMLQGVEAPDNIGTYSIVFEGVTNLTGDPTSGYDLTPGVVKQYNFEVAPMSQSQNETINNGAEYIPLPYDPEAALVQ